MRSLSKFIACFFKNQEAFWPVRLYYEWSSSQNFIFRAITRCLPVFPSGKVLILILLGQMYHFHQLRLMSIWFQQLERFYMSTLYWSRLFVLFGPIPWAYGHDQPASIFYEIQNFVFVSFGCIGIWKFVGI